MKIKARIDSQLQELEVIEDLGYQISLDVYVVRARMPDNRVGTFTSFKKNGIYSLHRIVVLPGSPITAN